MALWKCKKCGHVYGNKDVEIREGLPDGSMLATYDMLEVEEHLNEVPFEDLPTSWVCPECQSKKEHFEKVEEKKHLEEMKRKGVDRWRCKPCDYIYDPEIGDPDGGISPGVKFEDLPDDWVCPLCGAPKEEFEKTD